MWALLFFGLMPFLNIDPKCVVEGVGIVSLTWETFSDAIVVQFDKVEKSSTESFDTLAAKSAI